MVGKEESEEAAVRRKEKISREVESDTRDDKEGSRLPVGARSEKFLYERRYADS